MVEYLSEQILKVTENNSILTNQEIAIMLGVSESDPPYGKILNTADRERYRSEKLGNPLYEDLRSVGIYVRYFSKSE